MKAHERVIADLAAKGRTDLDIAHTLGLRVDTVRREAARIGLDLRVDVRLGGLRAVAPEIERDADGLPVRLWL